MERAQRWAPISFGPPSFGAPYSETVYYLDISVHSCHNIARSVRDTNIMYSPKIKRERTSVEKRRLVCSDITTLFLSVLETDSRNDHRSFKQWKWLRHCFVRSDFFAGSKLNNRHSIECSAGQLARVMSCSPKSSSQSSKQLQEVFSAFIYIFLWDGICTLYEDQGTIWRLTFSMHFLVDTGVLE